MRNENVEKIKAAQVRILKLKERIQKRKNKISSICGGQGPEVLNTLKKNSKNHKLFVDIAVGRLLDLEKKRNEELKKLEKNQNLKISSLDLRLLDLRKQKYIRLSRYLSIRSIFWKINYWVNNILGFYPMERL